MNAMTISVLAAFFDSGRRNAGTPFEIASTPVSATAPDEKPLRIRKRPSEPAAERHLRFLRVERDVPEVAEEALRTARCPTSSETMTM